MPKKSVLLIKHSQNWSGDRCSAWFAKNGYDIRWCYPADGEDLPDPHHYTAAVVYGGRNSVNDPEAWIAKELDWLSRCLKSNCRYLGICFGGQLLAKLLGGTVAPHTDQITEVGFTRIEPTAHADSFFLPEAMQLFQWHKEGFTLPQSTVALATGEVFPNQAFKYDDKHFGLQFHPEVNHTVARRWFELNDDYDKPGLDQASRDRQLEYALKHDAHIDTWFWNFLQHWLEE